MSAAAVNEKPGLTRWWRPARPFRLVCLYVGALQVMALGADTLDLDLALDLLEVADQYLVEALKRLCENAFAKTVSVRERK